MDRFDDDTLFAELQALRPTPRPEFTTELDERAAAGFPRRSSPSTAAMPFARLADRWRALSPRRRLVPALTVALAALMVATAVVAIAQSGTKSNPGEEAVLGMVPAPGESGRSADESATSGAPKLDAKKGETHHGGNGGAGGGNNPNETVYETAMPSVTSEPSRGAKSSAEAAPAEGGGSEAGAEEEAFGEEEGEPAEEAEEAGGAAAELPPTAPTLTPLDAEAPPLTHRDIERSAYVVLGTKPGEVSGAAAQVYEAVHAAHGVVLHSKVQSGSAGATGAYFELLIPSRKLDDALSAFSQIAEVRERHDATDDITAPTVGAAEELRDSNASLEGLLKELGQVETEAERESVEARLREERRQHAAIRARLDHLGKRASMSEVTVRIVTSHGAGATPPSKDDGSWGVGDALHDAGHILTIAAGILLIALAVLAPIALIVLIAWAANRVRMRRLRERTLG